MTDIKKVINKLKAGVKDSKVVEKVKTIQPKTPFNPVVKDSPKIRNMMQEAIDLGSHGASDMFKDIQK